MTPPDKITDTELNAYVDGELDASAAADVEAWLVDHPGDRGLVEEYRRQKQELHRLFDPALDEAAPPRMSETIAAGRRPRRPRISWWAQAAAAVVLIAAGAAGGWVARDTLISDVAEPAGFVDRAVGAHVVYAAEVRHPVEVGVAEEQHLVTWLSKRLGHSLRAPALQKAGFKLMGGRLLPDEGGPAAQFMYENGSGRRITLYVRAHDGKDTAFRFFSAGRISAFYWIDRPFAYALAGELSREELLAISNIVYGDLDPQGGGASAKPEKS